MGNHLSCVSASSSSAYDRADAADACTTPSINHTMMMIIKVLQPESGHVLELYEPTTAAELMLEYGALGHVVCDLTSHVAALSSPHHHNHANGDDDDHHHHQTQLELQQPLVRLSPLSADHQLALGRCYLLVPISRLTSRLSFHDLASYARALFPPSSPPPSKHTHINAAACKLPKPSSSHRRVAPVSSPMIFTRSPSLNIDPIRQYHSSSMALAPTPSSSVPLQLQQGMMICRTKSWSPQLETITELPTVF